MYDLLRVENRFKYVNKIFILESAYFKICDKQKEQIREAYF